MLIKDTDLATLRGCSDVAAELDRSRSRITQLALRFRLGVMVGTFRYYRPEDVAILRAFFMQHPKEGETK